MTGTNRGLVLWRRGEARSGRVVVSSSMTMSDGSGTVKMDGRMGTEGTTGTWIDEAKGEEGEALFDENGMATATDG